MNPRTFVFTLFAVVTGSACFGQNDSIPFKLNAHNNIYVEAIVNNVDTLDLMFHTDASAIALISSSTATMTSIQWGESGKATSWGGEHDSRSSKSNALAIGKLAWTDLMIYEDERSGPDTDGKFGPDLFAGKVIEVNYDKSVIVLHPSWPGELDAFTSVPLEVRNGSIFVEGKSFVGEELHTTMFLLHTGYGGTILFDDEFAAENELGKSIDIIDEQILKDSYGNEIVTKKGVMEEFFMGSMYFPYIPVGFFDGSIGRQRMSVLGADLLKRMNFVLDIENERMYIQGNQYTEVPYTVFKKG